MEDEVTRVKAVGYLEGASGHGAASTLFLLVGGLLFSLGRWGGGVVAILVAFGVSLNGLSIYAWDRLRARLRPVVERRGERERDATEGRAQAATGEERPTSARDIVPYRPSPAMLAELLAGLIMVGGFVGILGLGLLTLELLGPRPAVYLAVGGLAVGNLSGLWWAYRTASRR